MTFGWSDSPSARSKLRRLLSRTLRVLMRVRSRPLPLKDMASVLVVAPHPDDESLGCGGLIALLARSGCRLQIALVTDGEASHVGIPSCSTLNVAAIRSNEARDAAAILGVPLENLFHVGAADGRLSRLDATERSDALSKLSDLVRTFRPDTILLPLRRDGSDEHEACFLLATEAIEGAGLSCRVLEFPVWAWRNPTLLGWPLFASRDLWRVSLDGLTQVKRAAICAHKSQTTSITPDSSPLLSGDFLAEFFEPEEFFFEK